MKERGELNITFEEWLQDVAQEEPPPQGNERRLTKNEEKFLRAMKGEGHSIAFIKRKWADGHRLNPSMLGPAPARETITRIWREMEGE